MALVLLGAFVAPQAGRVSGGISDDVRPNDLVLAPEPLAASIALPCGLTASPEAREIVFERVQPGDVDADDIRQLAKGAREVVSFEWNAATGELTYDTTAPTGVFSDLVSASEPSAPSPPICESR